MLRSGNKQLGSLSVPLLGFGCANLSGLYGESVDNAGDILNFAIENGVNFFDSADAYDNGKNEELISCFLKKYDINRNKLIISTKCGVVWKNKANLSNKIDNSPQYIKHACEESLKRLKTDYIDLFYLHRIAGNGENIEESMEALKQLVIEGKIRHIGLSEVNSKIIQRAHQVHPLTAIQSEYSLMTRDPEINGVLETCRKLNIGFVAYSPLCRGLLSTDFNAEMVGKNNFRATLPRFKKENLERNISIVKQLKDFADHKKCSIAQLSLAWVLAQGKAVLPIPGTKCIKHLQENIASSHINLTNREINLLNQIFPVGVASGDRYSAAILRAYNLTTDAQ